MPDLFGESVQITFPRRYDVDGRINGNHIQHIASLEETEEIALSPFASRNVEGNVGGRSNEQQVLILPKRTTAQLEGYDLLLAPGATTPQEIQTQSEAGQLTWMRPTPQSPINIPLEQAIRSVGGITDSWKGQFSFKEEKRDGTGVIESGLRPPQIGAIHAALAHWSVSKAPATIVMPTGTGKTETMLSLAVSIEASRIMVVVPNGPLRDQIAEKFLTLGVLRKAGVLGDEARLPIVATLRRRPKTEQEVDEVFQRANVVVTTMQIAGQCEPEIQNRMAEHCSHLFIDEAHHVAAKTWRVFKSAFSEKTVLQFTATPFRTDGKRVDGKFIYVYPLAKAQAEQYFRPISFSAVRGLEQDASDGEIIRRIGEQLERDIHDGFDHLAMARVDGVDRAIALHRRYAATLPQYNPVIIHSRLSAGDKRSALAALRSRESKIIVCVDMLGEGFDLPELKVAGLHDRHKSIAITLQFTGRFTRDARNIGDATVIANIEQDDVEAALRTLYAEDADWNFLLTVLSETRTAKQMRRAEIIDGFGESLDEIPLQTLNPRMNAVVYRTECEEWRPDRIEDAFPPGVIFSGPVINDASRLAIFVTKDESDVRWSSTKTIVDTEWNLFMVHWDPETKLLYIASSKTKELHEKLAKAVGGASAQRISGEVIYRSLSGINRLVLMNLGLSQAFGRYVRYMMFVGSDITRELPDAATGSKRKSNLFGQGFSGDGKVTIGCSAKGKLWSMQSAADFSEWMDWCHSIGSKLLDETIETNQFVRNLITQEVVTERPDKPAVAIHWPEGLLIQFEERIDLKFGEDTSASFYKTEIELLGQDKTQPLRFAVVGPEHRAEFEVRFSETGVTYPQVAGPSTTIVVSKKERPLEEYFSEDPPHIHFADGDFLIANELFKLPRGAERRTFDEAKISHIDWDGVDFRRESQGIDKQAGTIQHRVIEHLRNADPSYEMLFDDDGTGEIADVVGIRRDGSTLYVHMVHCKFSQDKNAGHRVGDLYEVCGQAQKSVRWCEYPVRLLKRIRKRELDRIDARQPSRFEIGDLAIIRTLIADWQQYEFRYAVTIVQPGLSKAAIEPAQLDLLAATEAYLLETYGVSLNVIASR